VLSVGNKDDVRRAVLLLRSAGVRTVGLTDADAGHSGQDGVYSLPGNQPPEVLVFGSDAVQKYFAEKFDLSIAECLLGRRHHEYSKVVGDKIWMEEEVAASHACCEYISGSPDNHFESVISFVRKGLCG
jgi:hypothetical protein